MRQREITASGKSLTIESQVQRMPLHRTSGWNVHLAPKQYRRALKSCHKRDSAKHPILIFWNGRPDHAPGLPARGPCGEVVQNREDIRNGKVHCLIKRNITRLVEFASPNISWPFVHFLSCFCSFREKGSWQRREIYWEGSSSSARSRWTAGQRCRGSRCAWDATGCWEAGMFYVLWVWIMNFMGWRGRARSRNH